MNANVDAITWNVTLGQNLMAVQMFEELARSMGVRELEAIARVANERHEVQYEEAEIVERQDIVNEVADVAEWYAEVHQMIIEGVRYDQEEVTLFIRQLEYVVSRGLERMAALNMRNAEAAFEEWEDAQDWDLLINEEQDLGWMDIDEQHARG